jgi:CRP-like cAMP-binding protein
MAEVEVSADRETDSRSRSASPDAAAVRRDQAERALSFLRRVPLLSSAPLSALEALASVAQHYVVGRGEVVLQQGAAADDGVFFVKKGDFQVVQELPVYAANADSEAQAAKEFVLPPLSPEAAAVQRARLQASEQRRTRRQQQSQAASSASHASLHAVGANTFLTAAEAAQSRSSLLSGRSSNISGGGGHSDLMAAIHEHSTKGTHTADEEEEYTDLAAYDSANETKQQQSARRGQSQQQQQQLQRKSVLPRDASGSSRVGIDGDSGNPAGSGGGVIVGSRFLEVGTLGPYACFGEWAVLHRSPRSASVISRTSGGEVWAVTQFDFLRCCPRRLLADLRQISAMAYRSVAELELELDDTQQWQAYKTHLLALARDKSIRSHRQQNIPVFESVPVGAFNIRLPELKQNELLDDSDVPVVPPPRRRRNKRTLLQQRQQQFVGLAEHPALRSFAAAAASAAASSIAASAAIAHRRSALGLEQSDHVDSSNGTGRGSVSAAAPGSGGIASSRREATRLAAEVAKSPGRPTGTRDGGGNGASSGRQRRSLLSQQQHPPSPPHASGAATERSSVATAIGGAISHGRRQGAPNNARAKLIYADGSFSAR